MFNAGVLTDATVVIDSSDVTLVGSTFRETDRGTTVQETCSGHTKTAAGGTDEAHFPKRITPASDEPNKPGANQSQTGIHVPYVRSGTA